MSLGNSASAFSTLKAPSVTPWVNFTWSRFTVASASPHLYRVNAKKLTNTCSGVNIDCLYDYEQSHSNHPWNEFWLLNWWMLIGNPVKPQWHKAWINSENFCFGDGSWISWHYIGIDILMYPIVDPFLRLSLALALQFCPYHRKGVFLAKLQEGQLFKLIQFCRLTPFWSFNFLQCISGIACPIFFQKNCLITFG